jgi:RND family efflux transporter MFP subunit
MKRLWIAVVVAACGSREPATTEPDPAPKPRTEVQAPAVTNAQRGYIGVLTPRATNQVVSPLSAPIAEIVVQVGDTVKKGDTVARFDAKTLQQQLKIEQSTLAARRAEVGKAVGAANAARLLYFRDKKAFEQGIGSKQDMEQSLARYQEAQSEVSSAMANVEQQQNVIAKLKDSITNTTLVSPMDGRVGFIAVHRGDRIEEGHPVMRIDSDGAPVVKFAIPGEDAGHLNKGDAVDIVLESKGTLAGVLRVISPDIDPTAQMILAEADITSPPADLRTGVRCRVRKK